MSGTAATAGGDDPASGVRIVRGKDASVHGGRQQRAQDEAGFTLHPAIERGMRLVRETPAGGATVRSLFEMPGLHIAYAWFKSGFPLPLHSHDVDCYYQLIAGTLRFGHETLAKGDGLFIPAGVPYTLTPGAAGVEFLEIRTSGDWDTHYRARTDAYWDRIVARRHEGAARWAEEAPPYDLLALASGVTPSADA